jgi:hypothetical protein
MNKTLYLLLITILLFGGGCFFWVEYDTKKAEEIEGKVKEVISYAVVMQQMEGERILVKQQNSLPFYTPNFNNTEQKNNVFQKVVFYLNSEQSVPPIKLTYFNMFQSQSIDIHVEVNYTEAFGVKKKFVIHTTAKIKAFKHKTGPEAFN